MKIHIAIADTNPAYAHRLGRALQDLSGGSYEIDDWPPEKVRKAREKIQKNEQDGFLKQDGLLMEDDDLLKQDSLIKEGDLLKESDFSKEGDRLDAIIFDAQYWKDDPILWRQILGALANIPPKKKILLWKGSLETLGAMAGKEEAAGNGDVHVDRLFAWEGPVEAFNPFASVSQIFQVLEEGLRKIANLLPADEEKAGDGFMVVSAFDPGLRRQFIRKKLREYAQKGESCLYLPFMPIFELQLPLAVVGPDYEEPDAPDHMGLSTALLAWENGLEPDQQTLLHTIKPYALDIGSYYGPKLNGRAEDILQCKPETLVQCARAYAQMMTDLGEGSHCLIEAHLPLSHLVPLVRAADRFYCDFPPGPGTADFFARQELRLLLAGLPDNIKVIELKYIADRKTREEYFEEKKRRKTGKSRWFAR